MYRVRFGDFAELQPWIMGVVDQFRFHCEFGFLETANPDDYDCIVPLTIHHYGVLARYPELLGRKFWMPSPNVVDLCDDKLALNEYLLGTDFARLIPPLNGGRAPTFPYILKKRRDEYGIHSILIRDAAEEQRHRHLLVDDTYFTQAFIEGNEEYGLHMLVVDGAVIYSRTVKYSMNSSATVRGQKDAPVKLEHLKFSPELPTFEPLIISLGYVGTCCVDYKMQDGRPMLLEINPCYDGSLSGGINRYLEAYVESLDLNVRTAKAWVGRGLLGNDKMNESLRGDVEEIRGHLIKGWVMDVADPLSPLDLDVIVDGVRVGACTAGEFRADLKQAGAGTGRHGFRFMLPQSLADSGEHQIDIRASGAEVSIPGMPRTKRIGARLRAGYLRQGTMLRGFALAEAPGEAVKVTIATAGAAPSKAVELTANGKTSLPRIVGLPGSASGFEYDLAGLGVAEDAGEGAFEVIAGEAGESVGALSDGCFLDGLIEGNVDHIGTEAIRGWAWEPQRPGDRLGFELCFDGEGIGTTVAAAFRQDLLEAHKADGYCAYSVAIPNKGLDARVGWFSLRAVGRPLPFYIHPKPVSFLAPTIRLWQADDSMLEGEAYVHEAPFASVDLTVVVGEVGIDLRTAADHKFALDTRALLAASGTAVKDAGFEVRFADRAVHSGRLGAMPAVLPWARGVPAGRVAIVTRTRDRPILLERAAQSVLRQTYKDWVHFIVNDGGNVAEVESLASRHADAYGGRLRVIHNPTPAGMENASNIGILRSNSEYIALLDDDDSWSPAFLDRCVGYLTRSDDREAGVITLAMVVTERLERDAAVVLQTALFRDIAAVQLADVAEQNCFPNNSFVFKRAILAHVGYFDGSLPVLGDWDFNYRVLRRYDVGVVREPLAYYHQRVPATAEAAYLNTVVARQDQHSAYRARLINQWIREDMDAGRFGDGTLAFLGGRILDLRRQIEDIRIIIAK